MVEHVIKNSCELLVCGIPQGVHLFKVGSLLETAIGGDSSITSISWAEPEQEASNFCNVKIKLRNDTDEQWILSQPVIDVWIKKFRFPLTITKVRPKKTTCIDASTSTSDLLPEEEEEGKEEELRNDNLIKNGEHDDIDAEILSLVNEYCVEVDIDSMDAVLRHMKDSNELLKQLEKFMKKYSTVSLILSTAKPRHYILEFSPLIHQEDFDSQYEFDSKCNEMLQSFIAKFSTNIVSSSVQVLEDFKKKNSNLNEGVWEIYGQLQKIYLEWNLTDEPGNVLITGESFVVRSFVNQLQDHCKKWKDTAEKSAKHISGQLEEKDNEIKSEYLPHSLDKFCLPISIDTSDKVLAYMKDYKKLLKELENFMNKYSRVTLKFSTTDPSIYTLVFSPLPQQEDFDSQFDFNTKCQEMLQTFLSTYSTKIFKSSVQALKDFMEKNMLLEESVWKVFGHSHSIYLKWNFLNEPGYVAVTGENFVVNSFFNAVKDHCKEFENNKVKTSSVTSEKLEEIDIHFPIKWIELLEDYSELFTDFKERCILVQNIPKECDYDEVRSMFENISNNGKVKRIFLVPDGHLIFFEEKISVEVVLNEDEIVLRDAELTVYPKLVPTPDNTILCIKGKFSIDDIETLLRSCTAIHSKFHVHEVAPKRLLVIFENSQSTDITELKKEIEHNLKKQKATVLRLCRSDRISLTNVGHITDDQLKLYLKKKNYNTTLMVRRKNGSEMLLFLSDFRDVDKLLNEKVEINGVTAELSYFLPGVGKLEKPQYQAIVKANKRKARSSTKFKPKPFAREIPVDQLVKELVLTSQTLVGGLNEKLNGLAKIDFQSLTNKENILKIKFSPTLKQDDFEEDQESVERKCFEKVQKFLQQFTSKTLPSMPDGAIARLKKSSSSRRSNTSLIETDNICVLIKKIDSQKYGNFIKFSFFEEGLYFILLNGITFDRWSNDQKSSDMVAGTAAHINQLATMYEKSHSIILCSETEFKILTDCKITKAAQKEHFVKITRCTGSTYNLFVEGTKSDIDNAEKMLKNALKLIKEEKEFAFLEEAQKEFLVEKIGFDRRENQLRDIFLSKGIKACLQFTDTVTLFYKPESYSFAMQVILESINISKFQLKENPTEFFGDSNWKTIEDFVQNNPLVKYTCKEEFFTLVGFSPVFEEAQELVKSLLSQADENKRFVKMGKLQKKYISTFSDIIDDEGCLRDLKWKCVENGICLDGKRRTLKPAEEWLSKIAASLVETSHTIEEPWQIKYIKSEDGKLFLQDLEKKKQCVIIPETFKDESKLQTEQKDALNQNQLQGTFSSTFNLFQQLPIVKIPGTNVTVQVVKSNIVSHNVDAIVNASNEELELRSAGVSGSILQLGGQKIQDEMNDIKKKLKSNRLETGRAVTTSSGLLRNCRKIIHVAGPMWHQLNQKQASDKLKQSVRSCLIQAEFHKLQSLAIPAISCGVFGGKPKVCARLIVETIVEHFQSKTMSSIKQVDLIEVSNAQVITAFSTQLNLHPFQKNTAATSLTSTYQENSLFQPKPQSSGENFFNVIVSEGNAILDNAEVLVNTAGPNYNLYVSQFSKVVVREGGPGVVAACEDPIVNGDGFRISKSGILHFKLIAHLIVPYNLKAEKLVFNLVNLFKAVDELNCTSIALPAIGTGNASINQDEAVMLLRRSIEMFQETKPKNLLSIHVVIYEGKLVHKFKALESISKPLERTQSSFSTTFTFSQSDDLSSSVDPPLPTYKQHHSQPCLKLNFCSFNEETNSKCKQTIDWKFEMKYCDRLLADVPSNPTVDKYLKSLQESYPIQIEKITRDDKIQLCGLVEDVKNVSQKIENFLEENKN